MSHFDITEDASYSRPSRVDRAAGIIEDVKIVGLSSPSKKRDYTPDALRRAAPLYEGVKVNVDHPDPNNRGRRYADRIGRLTGIYFKEGEGLFAKKFAFNPDHPLAKSLGWWAENDPAGVGFSQVAGGKGRYLAGRQIIECIDSVASVDLVADPATTAGLFENDAKERDESDEDQIQHYRESENDSIDSKLLAAAYEDRSISLEELEDSELSENDADAAGVEVVDRKELARYYRR